MDVALVSEHASPLAVLGGVDAGGQNVHVAGLSAALARRGHRVRVYTRRDATDLREQVPAADGYTVVHVPAGPPRPLAKDDLLPWMDDLGRNLEADWAADPPDVVHSHFWMSGVAARRPARALGLPFVHTFHALGSVKRRHLGADDPSDPRRPAIEAELGRTADRVVATCSDEVAELQRLGVDWTRTAVVPCGVDVQRFTPGPRPTGGRRRVLAIGRLVRRKGYELVIRALPGLPDTELVVAGGSPADDPASAAEGARLSALAADLGVQDRVFLIGQVARASMPALLRSADVITCTPWYEPFGIVPLEAMACGRPVVATAVGGFLDTVVDGRTGLLVPPGQVDSLTEALRYLLHDPVWAGRLGAAGRRRAEEHYTWDRVAEQTEAVYEQVRQGAPRPPLTTVRAS